MPHGGCDAAHARPHRPDGQRGGFRGLPNGLAYGPTKAVLINPGLVETLLTAQNAFKMPALISPGQAARAILQGWARGQFEIHCPRRFTFWLQVLRCLPYPAFFALTRRLKSS